MQLHPYTRIFLLISGILGAVLCNDIYYLIGFWLIFLIPLIIINKNIKTHLNLIFIVALPMFFMLSLSHWVIAKNFTHFETVLLTVLKVIVYTSVIHIALIIPQEQILTTFKMWNFKNEVLITALGSYIVWVDITNRADKIITSRFSRGFINKRTLGSKLRQFPYLLIPLVIGIMRTATERADSWEQKNIIYRLEAIAGDKIRISIMFNILVTVGFLFWLSYNLFMKYF